MKLNGFVIAIRFNRSFAIVDNFGAIMDKLLYDSDEAFSNKVFTDVETYFDARILKNKENRNKLTINSENFILDFSDLEDFEKDFETYLDKFQKIIADDLFKQYDIKKINRFGCVIKTELENSDKFIKSVDNLIKQHKKDSESLSLRFNCTESQTKEIKGAITGDYKNEIVTYNREKKGSPLTFSVDYQYYFRPPLKKLEDSKIKFQTFCNDSYIKFKKDYLNI